MGQRIDPPRNIGLSLVGVTKAASMHYKLLGKKFVWLTLRNKQAESWPAMNQRGQKPVLERSDRLVQIIEQNLAYQKV